MKFVAISDTHGEHRSLELPAGDAIIHAGDFCHLGNDNDLYDFLDWYSKLDFEWKLLIGGNHDNLAADDRDYFLDILPKGITYLEDSGTVINDLKVWGSPVQPDLIGWPFGVARGAAMRKHWDLIPEDTDLLITHTPPHGILDRPRGGNPLGCEELAERLQKLQVKVHVFGHIHASYGILHQGTRTYMNASNMDSSKGLVNAPIEFEL